MNYYVKVAICALTVCLLLVFIGLASADWIKLEEGTYVYEGGNPEQVIILEELQAEIVTVELLLASYEVDIAQALEEILLLEEGNLKKAYSIVITDLEFYIRQQQYRIGRLKALELILLELP